MTETAMPHRLCVTVLMALTVSLASTAAIAADAKKTAGSFVEDFDSLDADRWYVSDGWSNGDHQNCTWSKDQVSVDGGKLELGFVKQKAGERDYECGEIQTKARYGYGTYEIRMKAGTGSGLNSAFFSYIGDADKQPHDEIDFEVLGKNPEEVQLNQYISGKGGNEKLVPVSGGAEKGYNDYAFTWEKDRIRYFVNGKLVHEVTDKSKIPTHEQKIFMSLWGTDTLASWMGAFSYNGPTNMMVDRVAFTALGDSCQFPQSVVCKLN